MDRHIKVKANKWKDRKLAKAYEVYINQPEVMEAIDKEVVKKIGSFLMWGPNGQPNNN